MIDKVLAQHYGFTEEELDFIPSALLRTGINYDIKYRMGKELEGEGGVIETCETKGYNK